MCPQGAQLVVRLAIGALAVEEMVIGTAREDDDLDVLRELAQALLEPGHPLRICLSELVVEEDRAAELFGEGQAEDGRELLAGANGAAGQVAGLAGGLDAGGLEGGPSSRAP